MKAFNKVFTVTLFAVFTITLAMIGRQVYCQNINFLIKDKFSNLNDQYQLAAKIDLTPVEVKHYKVMGFTKGLVRFSPDSKVLVAGTDNGEVLAMSTQGKVLWQKKMGLGKITALEISKDSKSLYIGEQSPDGFVYSLDLHTGIERWKISVTQDVGTDFRQKMLPSIAKIVQDMQGHIYVLAMRYERQNDNRHRYTGKLYCLDAASGSNVWSFPKDGPMDAWVSWCSVDEQGKFLAFGTANFEQNNTYKYPENLYCISAQDGSFLWSTAVPPVKPFEKTIIRTSPNFSSDGRYLAAMCSDGRALLFDSQGKELWQRVLSRPKQIGGVYLNSVGRDAYVINDRAVFTTVNTYNNANWQLSTPVEHPNSNSVFIFDLQGNFQGHWKAGGSVEEVAFARDAVIAAVGRNTKVKDSEAHGVYFLSLNRANILSVLPSQGPAVGVAATPDRKYVAYIEAPVRYDDGEIVGAHRLFLWKLKE